MRFTRITKVVSIASLGLVFSLAAWCQATAGRGAIAGTVLDASGAPRPRSSA